MKRIVFSWFITCLAISLWAQEKEESGQVIIHPVISATQSFLTQGFDPWQSYAGAVAFKKESKWILTPGVSYFRRFNAHGFAFSMDNYAFLPNQWYINAQFRINEGVFLPNWDYSFTIFKNIGKFEASLGVKQLYFDQTITMFPVSAGVYLGNYWISYQNFTGWEASSGRVTSSNLLTSRRYLATARQYLELKLGLGQELNILSERNQVSLIPNQLVAVGYQQPIKKRTMGFYVAVNREEIRLNTIRYRTAFTVIFK